MKQLVTVFAICAVFSVAAFGVLVTADRRLGLPLPYSIPFSFTVVSLGAPVLFAIANAIRLRRPVMVKPAPIIRRASQPLEGAAPIRRVQGVVLLDFSGAGKLTERAA